ncbi:hypothetical protein IWZ00DRAFT_545325 [Phyllosticta capitalensis]
MSKYLAKTDDKKRGQRKKAGTDSSGSEYAPTQGNAPGGQDPGPGRKSSRTRAKSEAKRIQKDSSRGRGRGRGAPGSDEHTATKDQLKTSRDELKKQKEPEKVNLSLDSRSTNLNATSQSANRKRERIAELEKKLETAEATAKQAPGTYIDGNPTLLCDWCTVIPDSDSSTEHLKLEAAFPGIRPPMPKKSSAHTDAATVVSEVVAKLDEPRARLDQDTSADHPREHCYWLISL